MAETSDRQRDLSADRAAQERPADAALRGRDPEADPIAEWILGSMSSGIIAIDQAGLVAILNGGAQRILGCRDADHSAAIGQPVRDVLKSQPAVGNLLLDTLEGRPALSRAELVLENAGSQFASTIGFTLTPVLDPEGAIRGAAMIFRDLTPFERMDEQERLTERLAALGQMAAGLAHEIRNPLAGMEVIAGLLKRRLVDRENERELLDQLTGELRRLAGTVTDCLEFVRPASPELCPTDPIGLVEDSLATALTRFGFDGTIERAFDSDVEKVSADEAQLRAVITDLIVNAFEAMAGDNDGREKRILLGVSWPTSSEQAFSELSRPIRLDREGVSSVSRGGSREIVITVSDTGPGVPEPLRERIFYPFFTTKETGSGVGLATAQKIAASHGGALELEQSIGSDRGATFRLRLQIEQDDPL